MSATIQSKELAGDVEKKRKEISSDAASNPQEFVSENRLHKRRQRKRNQDRKQNALTELMNRIDSMDDGLSASKVKSMYTSIPSSDPNEKKYFWSKIPCTCDPCKAVMDKSIADDTKLDRDKTYQKKYKKKLAAMQKKGKITEAEKEEMWSKHGRSTEDTMAVSLLSARRGQRKAWQIENFAFLLTKLIEKRPSAAKNPFTVVDFSCGSGNLCLALAAYFENVRFVLVDKKPYPLKLAERRAKEARLSNVGILQYTFSPQNLSDFCPTSNTDTGSSSNATRGKVMEFDVGIGLHCCGSFTDMVMELCLKRGATCIVCPCCNGAMTSKTTSGYQYPRSSSFREIMNQDEYLGQLSKSADDLGNYEAKCLIEYDRVLWAQESGFREVSMWKLNPTESTPKHHVLCLEC